MRYISFILWILLPTLLSATEVSIQNPAQNQTKSISNNSKLSDKVSVVKSVGQKIYEQHCIVCHRHGIAGAPKFRDEKSWEPYLAQGDMQILTATAIKGKNAMPPKGTCQECIDSDIKAAIEFMVPQK